MKVIRNADNKLMNARIKDEIAFEACGVFQVRELKRAASGKRRTLKISARSRPKPSNALG